MSISTYFNRLKRPHSSASSESDLDSTPKPKNSNKKPNVNCEDDADMSLKEKLEDILIRIDKLATKDICQIKKEVQTLTDNLVEKLEKIEGRVFEVEAKWDEIDNEISRLRRENEELKTCMKSNENLYRKSLNEVNEVQQYTRRWNLRIFRAPEKRNETATECVEKCCEIFNEKVKVNTTPEDIEIAHRTGKPGPNRPIIVRFFDRKKRDQVLANRRNLKNKGIVIAEDLTLANYKVYMQATKHSACANTWTSNGRILAKLKNGVLIKLDINSDVDQTFRKAMTNKQR